MKQKVLSLILALTLCLSLAVQAAASGDIAPQQAYDAMIALKAQYPEGTRWDNSSYYAWRGGIYSGGYGCAGFAFMLSDAAFGELPARMLTDFAYSDVRVGDILRMLGNTHSVIVLETADDGVVIAEGNFNSSVHWGRTLTRDEVLTSDYIITRYPEDAGQTDAGPVPGTPDVTPAGPSENIPAPGVSFSDVASGDWCYDDVMKCAGLGIVAGFPDGTFKPGEEVTAVQFLVMLTRTFCNSQVEAVQAQNVPGAAWYYPNVTAADNTGMTDSLAAADINNSVGMTRYNMARVLYNIIVMGGRQPSAAGLLTGAGAITDYSSIPQDCAAPVAACYALGILGGMSDGSFQGAQTMTRAQACAVIMRMLALISG